MNTGTLYASWTVYAENESRINSSLGFLAGVAKGSSEQTEV